MRSSCFVLGILRPWWRQVPRSKQCDLKISLLLNALSKDGSWAMIPSFRRCQWIPLRLSLDKNPTQSRLRLNFPPCNNPSLAVYTSKHHFLLFLTLFIYIIEILSGSAEELKIVWGVRMKLLLHIRSIVFDGRKNQNWEPMKIPCRPLQRMRDLLVFGRGSVALEV